MKPNKRTLSICKEYGFDKAVFLYKTDDGFAVFGMAFNDPQKVAYIGQNILIVQKGEKACKVEEDFIDIRPFDFD